MRTTGYLQRTTTTTSTITSAIGHTFNGTSYHRPCHENKKVVGTGRRFFPLSRRSTKDSLDFAEERPPPAPPRRRTPSIVMVNNNHNNNQQYHETKTETETKRVTKLPTPTTAPPSSSTPLSQLKQEIVGILTTPSNLPSSSKNSTYQQQFNKNTPGAYYFTTNNRATTVPTITAATTTTTTTTPAVATTRATNNHQDISMERRSMASGSRSDERTQRVTTNTNHRHLPTNHNSTLSTTSVSTLTASNTTSTSTSTPPRTYHTNYARIQESNHDHDHDAFVSNTVNGSNYHTASISNNAAATNGTIETEHMTSSPPELLEMLQLRLLAWEVSGKEDNDNIRGIRAYVTQETFLRQEKMRNKTEREQVAEALRLSVAQSSYK